MLYLYFLNNHYYYIVPFKFSVLFCFVFISKARLCLICLSFDLCLFSFSLFLCILCFFSFLFLLLFIQFGRVFSSFNLSRFIFLSFIFGYYVFSFICYFMFLFWKLFLFFYILNLEHKFTRWIDNLQIQEKKCIEWKNKTTIEKIAHTTYSTTNTHT